MAEEGVDLPVIPEVTMTSGIELRRHSAGIASFGNNEKKVVPHYLRASTGSCHDFCKYGKKHVQEVREKFQMAKRAGRKPLHQSSEERIGGKKTSVAEHKASVAEHKASVDPELQISDSSGTNKLELPTKTSGSQKQMGNEVLGNKNKASLARVKPSFLPKSHVSSIPIARRQGISSSFEVETPSKPTSKKVETSSISSSPLKSTPKRVKTHPKPTFPMVKTSTKSTCKMKRTSLKVSSFEDKEVEFSEKHMTSLKPYFVTLQTVSSLNSSVGFGGQRNSKIQIRKREASCKVGSPLLSSKTSGRRTVSIGARKHKGLKIVSHHKNQPKHRKVEPEGHNNEAQEKTLYVIKMESANQTLQSDDQNESQDIELSLSNSLSSPKLSSSTISQPSSQEESEYPTSEFEKDFSSENHEIEYMEKVENMKVEENGKPQKDGIVFSEDKKCKKVGGKLAKTEIDKSDPRRLKFRRGKVLGDNATDVKADSDNIDAVTGPETVVLRHQDVQVKKDGQGLYNHVIEETASKLVETRKSKVKALVGAFETVIFLQEKRTSANIAN